MGVQVHLALLGEPAVDRPARVFISLADRASLGEHRLTRDPERAEVILFTQLHLTWPDWRLMCIRRHELAQRFPDRVLVYDERDRPWTAFPGVYVSMPRHRFRPEVHRAWSYYMVEPATPAPEPDLLFSL